MGSGVLSAPLAEGALEPPGLRGRQHKRGGLICLDSRLRRLIRPSTRFLSWLGLGVAAQRVAGEGRSVIIVHNLLNYDK